MDLKSLSELTQDELNLLSDPISIMHKYREDFDSKYLNNLLDKCYELLSGVNDDKETFSTIETDLGNTDKLALTVVNLDDRIVPYTTSQSLIAAISASKVIVKRKYDSKSDYIDKCYQLACELAYQDIIDVSTYTSTLTGIESVRFLSNKQVPNKLVDELLKCKVYDKYPSVSPKVDECVYIRTANKVSYSVNTAVADMEPVLPPNVTHRASAKKVLQTIVENADTQYHLDWFQDDRGRKYSGSGISLHNCEYYRAISDFTKGKPITPESVKWLYIDLANTYNNARSYSEEPGILKIVRIRDGAEGYVETMGEAVDIVKTKPAYIQKCLDGEKDHHKGFTFEIISKKDYEESL